MNRTLFLTFLFSLLLAGCAAILQDCLDDAVDSLEYSMDDASACEKKCIAKEGTDYQACYDDCRKDRALELKEPRRKRATSRSRQKREDERTCAARCNQKGDSARSACVRDCRWELSSTFLERLDRKVREDRDE